MRRPPGTPGRRGPGAPVALATDHRPRPGAVTTLESTWWPAAGAVAAELQFAAMGTTVHLIVVGANESEGNRLAETARHRVHQLERLWSRFLDSSEVTALNSHAGRPYVVSPETYAVVHKAVLGWKMTGGRFDPTILPALLRAGYDRDFDQGLVTPTGRDRPSTAPGCESFVLDEPLRAITLPTDVAIDLGGIGKGVAADLVTEELRQAGARGTCVNVGGDLRVEGESPTGAGWVLGINDPLGADEVLAHVHLNRGAVASTWRTRRAWGADGARRHHLIDPRTGEPAWSGLAGVSVLAGEGWRAEVLAKASFLAGPVEGAALLRHHGAHGLLLTDDHRLIPAGDVEAFLR